MPPPFRDDRRPILVGMVHLGPLPGSPRYGGSMSAVLDAARADAAALAEGGADAIMVENIGDVPFFKSRVPPATVAAMTAAVVAVRAEVGELPVGVNVLRNDGRSAVAVAAATGAAFVRVNVLCGARVTDQGVIEGEAADMLRDRAVLGADVRIWADVDVKHSAPLAARPIAEEVADTIRRGLADALIVSGGGTGRPTDPAKAETVKAAADVPVLVGSGATPESAADLLRHVEGLIAGTWIKRDGRVENPVDSSRVRNPCRRRPFGAVAAGRSPAATTRATTES